MLNLKKRLALGAGIVLAGMLSPVASAEPITRTGAGSFPISAAVKVPAGSDLYYLSGQVPDIADPAAPKDSIQAFGDTEVQTVSVLNRIKATLAAQGLGLGDVVLMHVYLVGDPAKGGKLDFAGMMAGYTKFFGTADQPNKPARSTLQVAALAGPGYLVEIEVVAAKSR